MATTNVRYKYNQRLVKKKRGKKLGLISAALLVLVSSGGYSALALTKKIPSVSAQPTAVVASTPQTISLPWPGQGQAAVGSLVDGVLAASSSIEQQKPIASMAKIVTALAILEKRPLTVGEQGPTYQISAADVAIYNDYIAKLGSVMPVREGQQISEYQALQALLLPSANNIADSLTIWVFGTSESFVVYANQLVKSYGLEHTSIADASGFSPLTTSTPSDMIALGQKALSHPVIAEIIATKQATIPDSGIIKNTNQLLQDQDMVGIKTGTSDQAGSCLLFAIKHGPDKSHILIGVVMGAPNGPAVFQTSRQLRDAVLGQYGINEILPANSIVGTYKTAWGQTSDLVTKDALQLYDWKGKTFIPEVSLESANIPAEADQTVGEAKFKTLTVRVVVKSKINPPSIWWRLTNYW